MTKNASQTGKSGREQPKGGTSGSDAKVEKTPNTDMQADDAGTEESGVEPGRATAAEAAMKQTGKTDHETGSKR